MKFLIVVKYNGDKAAIDSHAKPHHDYLYGVLQAGNLFAAGRRSANEGAAWIVDANDAQSVEKVVKDDPFYAAGVVEGWDIYPLANWSAKEYKGT